MRQCSLHRVIGCGECHLPAKGVVSTPGQIIVRARGVTDAPMRHGAFRVMLQRGLEALDGLAMVEAEDPIETAIKPQLRVRRRSGDFPAVRAEIKVGHGSFPQTILPSATCPAYETKCACPSCSDVPAVDRSRSTIRQACLSAPEAEASRR